MQFSDRPRNRNSAVAGVLAHITDQLSSRGKWHENLERALSLLCDSLPGETVVLVTNIDGWRLFHCGEVEDPDELELRLQEYYSTITQSSQLPLTAHPKNGGRRAIRESDGVSSSSINVPVIGADDVLGVMHIGCDRPFAYGHEDVTVMSIVASKIGAFLADARRETQAQITRASQDVQERLAQLAAIVESSEDAIIGKSLDGIIQTWNAGAREIYGYTAEEVAGKNISILAPPDRPNEIPEILGKIRRGERIHHYEAERIAKDGRRIYVSLGISPVRNSSGEIVGASTIARDITDRKKMEEALRENERFVRATLDSLSAHVAILDENGAIIYTNRAWQEFATANNCDMSSDMLGVNYLSTCDCAAGDDVDTAGKAAEGIRDVINGRKHNFEMEYPCHSPRQRRWFTVRVTGFRGAKLGRVVIAHENITQRVLAEEELRASEEKFSRAFRASPEILVISDLDTGCYTDVNETFEEIIGYSHEEAVGFTASELNIWVDDTERDNLVRTLRQGKPVHNYESRFRTKSGRIINGLLSADTMELGGRKRILAIVSDITERKRADFELALAREEALFRAEEMTALKTEAEMRAEEMARLRTEAELRAREAEEGRRILEALMEYVPEGIVIADAPDTVVRMITKSGLDMGGFDREAVQGKRLREVAETFQFLHTEDLTPARLEEMPLERAVKGEIAINEEWIIIGVNGNPLPILCSAGPIRDRLGNIVGGIATWREITDIKATQKGLEDAYEREHHIADVLQRALIPIIARTVDGYAMSAYYQPALAEAEVGGDFYDVFDLPGGKTAILLGDVSGKGLKAAEYTAMVKYMVRGYAYENPEPEYVLARLNNAAHHYVQEDLFVTAFYAVLDAAAHTLIYANAGHELPLHYNAVKGSAASLDITGRAIGIFPGGGYSSRGIDLKPGDILVLYTDGISEAGVPDEPIGTDGIAKVLAEHSAESEEEIIKAIFSAARDAAGGRLHDDAAVLVLKEKLVR